MPGPGFVSPLDPGLYRASLVVVLAGGGAVRVTSHVMPAFGGELCRLLLEPLPSVPEDRLGSFFDPSRRGVIYTMAADRTAGATTPVDRPGWSYHGPSLAERLAYPTRLNLLREEGRGVSDGQPFAWIAHRGLVVTGSDGEESLLLAEPEAREQAAFLPAAGAYRALLEPHRPSTPGASVRDLLGYGDWDDPLEVTVSLERLDT